MQSRYYDPELGRFINADTFSATGQGLLGNNMFVYCNNSPVMYIDICGARPVWNEGNLGGAKVYSDTATRMKALPSDLDAVVSEGIFVSVTVGVFNMSGSLSMAADTDGNVQPQVSVGFDVTSSGTLSVTVGGVSALYIAPDISSLLGDTYSAGGGISVPIPSAPIAGSVSGNVAKTGDGYWGIVLTRGITPVSNSGGEFHGGYSYTAPVLPAINIFEIFEYFCDS